MKEQKQMIETTKLWLERFVIGLNLCPFAKHPFKNGKIRYVVFEGDDLEKLTETVLKEANELAETSPSVLETTLIILPEVLGEFEEYLEYLEMVEYIFAEVDFEGVIQVASFHPDYQFEDTEITDVENYTNRSPFPMLHLLREDSVTRAIEAYPEVGDIPEKNIQTMNDLGSTRVKQMLDEIIRTN
ncbi:MAG: DUF1415 domain-containing protein [Saprospiraceae bacterium]|nr:DUF1415 domain-containing protein [Saprospiraceae bacterium]